MRAKAFLLAAFASLVDVKGFEFLKSGKKVPAGKRKRLSRLFRPPAGERERLRRQIRENEDAYAAWHNPAWRGQAWVTRRWPGWDFTVSPR